MGTGPTSRLAQSTGPTTANEIVTPLYSSARPASVVLPRRQPGTAPSHPPASPQVGTIDESTRWQFVTRENIAIDRSLIRLGDVIRPLESSLGGWSRLSQSTIGLMPADGGDAKISRDRLAKMIIGANATPGKIKIYGPDTIVVGRAAKVIQPTAPNPSTPNPSTPNPIATAGYEQSREPIGSQPRAMESMGSDRIVAQADPIDPATSDRIRQWVDIGIRNQHQEVSRGFTSEIKFEPNEFGTLELLQGIRQMVFLDPQPVWSHELTDPIDCRIKIIGRAGLDSCEGIARVTFQPRPSIVTARNSLRRGHRVTRSDLQYQPYVVETVSMPVDAITSPDDVIGLEVVGLVRPRVALIPSAFAAPRVVRRGDLVEIRVGGGGVHVTTAAKTLGDGAVGDLVEIETLQPKRRLLARVVHSTLVEIVTRAPRVAAEPAR